MTSSEKQLIGSRSRAAGAAFEKLIEVSCKVYKSRNWAYIEKTPEPMRPISRADRCGRFTAVYTATAQPDYKGSVYLDFLPAAVRQEAEALKKVHEELCNAIIQTDIFKSFFNDEGVGT